MKKLFFKMFIPTLGIAFICSGCIPYRVQQTPHIAGRVIDQSTKQPVSNAKLYYEQFPKQTISTSSYGCFDFPIIYRWWLLPLGPDDFRISQQLIIEADNHQPTQMKFSWMGIQSPVETNKIIYLQ